MILEYMTKLASDVLDYRVDMRRWLARGERITAARATTSPSTLQVVALTYADTELTVRLANGLGRHVVQVLVTTSTGQEKTVQFGIAVQAGAGDGLPTISVGGGMVIGGGSKPPEPLPVYVSVADTRVRAIATYTPTPPDPDPDPDGELFARGASIVDSNNEAVQLRSVNWFGAESSNNLPHGIWAVSYKDILAKIKGMGFNSIRMPFSGDTFRAGQTVNGINTSVEDNHVFIQSGDPTKPNEVVFKTPFECMDIIIAHAKTLGLMVVLDHHRRQAGAGADGAPTGAGYTTADWHATWTAVATRYREHTNVVGADVHNEPHDLEWGAWASAAEGCAAAIHAVAPHWLIFVEGVGAYNGESYWWGGALQGVRDRPVVLGVQHKLVYSPHEYGQSVGQQSWLRYDGGPTPPNWPVNLLSVMGRAWGYIAMEGIAPIWIGEFGGKFGRNNDTGAADPGGSPHGVYEAQWLGQLEQLITDNGISYAYWSLNPNSVDTGGLLLGDWTGTQDYKLNLLIPLLGSH